VESTLTLFHASPVPIFLKVETPLDLVPHLTSHSEKVWEQQPPSRIANSAQNTSTVQEALLIHLISHAQMVEFALSVMVNPFCAPLVITARDKEQ
jgi:hypothetical protein